MRKRRAGSLIFIVVLAFGSLIATLVTGSSPELGLDLQGGASVVLQPPDGTPSDAIDQAIEIIRSRVDALGVAEPDIVRQGDTVLVELPGVRDQQRALDIVGQTAELRFRPVLEVLPPDGAEGIDEDGTTTTTAAGDGTTTTTAAGDETTTTTTAAPIATTDREEDRAEEEVVLPDRDDPLRYRLGPTTVFGSGIATARAEFDGISQWAVALEMTSAGINGFNELAGQCFARQPTCPSGLLAITLDGEVVSAPQIQEPTFERDRIQITGGFSEGEAKDLALVLRYGSLPVQLDQQDAQVVSASLGRDSLRAGLVAGAVGAAIVLLYMVLYYRLLGLVVISGLCVWAALQWSVISWLGETQGLALSLSGVTGIIVSIGITVDSYIVYFERLKDELRRGSTLRVAVDRGFRHALRTTIIANTAALIGAATLYLLTVGPVRGFAFFLGLATILDLIVFWLYTRPATAMLARRRRFTAGAFIGMTTAAPISGSGS
ncbi:MAG TPA: protein translocase subunit SecD [Acidimicrobiales bacterium]|nr:protein translocase subunit SecD [Acidimicrobiales bacterium]